jgi:hypothetical protein
MSGGRRSGRGREQAGRKAGEARGEDRRERRREKRGRGGERRRRRGRCGFGDHGKGAGRRAVPILVIAMMGRRGEAAAGHDPRQAVARREHEARRNAGPKHQREEQDDQRGAGSRHPDSIVQRRTVEKALFGPLWRLLYEAAMLRRAILLCGLAALPPAPAAAATFNSVYTMLNLDRCRTLEVVPEGESVRRRCPGLGAIALFVNAGDGRFDVDAGVDNERWESLGGFNEIGPRIEWRRAAGRPFAIIYRLRLTSPEQPPGSSLIVETIGRRGAPGCQIATVDGGLADANARARAIADRRARTFRCPRS